MLEVPTYDRSSKALLQPWSGYDYFATHDDCKFNCDASEYDVRNAWWMSEMSRLIYHYNYNAQRVELEKVGLKQIKRIKKKNLCCSIFSTDLDKWDNDITFLVFRGTVSLSDWTKNFQFWPKNTVSSGRIHAGFNKILKSGIKEINEELKDVTGPLFLCGHSLGAALAVLASVELTIPVQAVYALGMPLVGDRVFANASADIPIMRIVNGSDLACHVPPAYLFGYRLLGDKQYMQPSRTPYRISNLPTCLSDHAPINYTSALAKLVNEIET